VSPRRDPKSGPGRTTQKPRKPAKTREPHDASGLPRGSSYSLGQPRLRPPGPGISRRVVQQRRCPVQYGPLPREKVGPEGTGQRSLREQVQAIRQASALLIHSALRCYGICCAAGARRHLCCHWR
jgi:hypothetical protein